uniref:RRM domain-containing protein n=1 Tax=Chromera velia CCMP2878 TaxID=1169474 RepID=A0A0G4F9A6_9ALVE|eukprot:Cvel_2957.t1-p1 / transcript=Cvel_2957.t1 / gene=Cvel_2957 / organism=Chromera_velia_CCMP2878 / gene_product=hypothetical protein / transcript_product=hypothetical protein / location=Cvel_scaffold117:33443-36127(-) / protein_length=315 / sequence_SO=supercontig / SO=protein_coding / is_pseudo=false
MSMEDVEVIGEKNIRPSSRIFGSALANVTSQHGRRNPISIDDDSPRGHQAEAAAVAATGGRRSIFDRMENPPQHATRNVKLTPAGSGGAMRSMGRGGMRAEPYGGAARLRSKEEVEAWQHDLFDGPVKTYEVFVRNLPPTATASQLQALFKRAGQVASVKLDTTSALHTATVSFLRKDAAFAAQQKLHGSRVNGQPIKVAVVEETNASRDGGGSAEQEEKERQIEAEIRNARHVPQVDGEAMETDEGMGDGVGDGGSRRGSSGIGGGVRLVPNGASRGGGGGGVVLRARGDEAAAGSNMRSQGPQGRVSIFDRMG